MTGWTPRRPQLLPALLTLSLLLATSAAWADQVTPNDRVTTRLRVRAEASSDAEIVGYLKPGDQVPLVKTSGAWREVQLPDTTGYVASSYTTVVPDPKLAAGTVYSIRVGSWNMKKLGHGEKKDYAKLAEVVDANFDILAVVEVMQKGGGHPGYDDLMAKLGSAWSGQVTDTSRPATSSGSSEFYAIVWRSSTLRPCAGWDGLRYFVDNDGSSSGQGPDNFAREPAYGCYEYGPASAPAGDLLMAAFHASFNNGDDAIINAEVKHLKDVFASMQAARPGEKDLMITGDFNRVPSEIASLLPEFADRTEGTASTLNNTGNLSANLYDHVIVYDPVATTEIQGNAKVLDVRNVAASPLEFYRTVSDHLPIMVVFQSAKDDD